MRRATVAILGAGQAGLAMSRCLTDRSIDHVVIERERTANSWRTERWDSLRLLTPNWLSRLPGAQYRGSDPHGYMTAGQVVEYLEGYRRSFDAPVLDDTTVQRISRAGRTFRIDTDRGPWSSDTVVVATGACSSPFVPAVADALPSTMNQITPIDYRNPSALPDGGVLVVGASASGAQIAFELANSGRDVTLAVGEHTRLPRLYRGRDIHWWMDALGQLDERQEDMVDIVRARRLPSLQLVGSPSRHSLGLNELRSAGVELLGRLVGVAGHDMQFSGSLANVCAAADLKQNRLLDLIDDFAVTTGRDSEIDPPDRPDGTVVTTPPNRRFVGDFSTVVWATGFRPEYPWLEPHLLDRKGMIVHCGGIMTQPGMYVLGLPFLRRRKSSFLDGVGPDANDLSSHLAGFLDQQARRHGVSTTA